METDSVRPALRVHLALLVVQLTFGGFSVFGKYVLGTVPPLAVAGLRVLFATPIIYAIAWHRHHVLPPRREMPMLALLGLLGVCANQLMFIVGLKYTTAINTTILITSIPVFTVLVASLLRVERLQKHRLPGVALAVAGALVMLDPSQLSLQGTSSVGNLLIVLNCLSYAGFLVLATPVLKRLPPFTVVAWSYVFGGGAVFVVSLPSLFALDPSAIPASAWIGVGYIVVFASVVSYALNTWAIRHSSSALVATYTTLQPVVAAVLAVLFLGESAGWREAAGFVLIVAGLAWITRSRSTRAGRDSE